MGFAFQQTDTPSSGIAPGPSGTPSWSTGVYARVVGLGLRLGWGPNPPNPFAHDPPGGIYWPHVLPYEAQIGGTAGSTIFIVTMKIGPITNGVVAHAWLLDPAWVVPAGDWTLRLAFPIQVNSDKFCTGVAVGTWREQSGTWSNGTSILNQTFASAIPLSQIGVTEIEETVAGVEAVVDPAYNTFCYVSWMFRNDTPAEESFKVYSKRIYDTPIRWRVTTAGGAALSSENVTIGV